MAQINLLPDVKKDLLKAQRQRNFVMSICLFVSIGAGAIVLILAGILGGQAIQKGILNGSIDENAKKISQKQSDAQLDEYLTLKNQLSQITQLKDSQLVYSRLFDYMRELNPAAPNSVSLSSVKLTGPGSALASETTSNKETVSVELQGVTTDYPGLAVFETTLSLAKLSFAAGQGADVKTESLFSSVTTKSSSLSKSNELSFTIVVEFNKAAFDPNSVNIKLDIPNETTSDADRNTPKDVFDNNASTNQGGAQ